MHSWHQLRKTIWIDSRQILTGILIQAVHEGLSKNISDIPKNLLERRDAFQFDDFHVCKGRNSNLHLIDNNLFLFSRTRRNANEQDLLYGEMDIKSLNHDLENEKKFEDRSTILVIRSRASTAFRREFPTYFHQESLSLSVRDWRGAYLRL